MNRRAFLLAGAATLAGCGSTGDGDGGGRTVNPALRETPTPTAAPTPTPTPSAGEEADGGGLLDRARSVRVANRLVLPEWIYLGVRAGGERVLETTFRVPAAGRTSVTGVLRRARRYSVSVRAADGRARTFEWTPPAAGADLAVDLDGGISVRDGYDAAAARGFVASASASPLAPASGGGVPLVLDNPGRGRTVRVATADGDRSAGAEVRLPPRSRVPLELSVPAGRTVVSVETDRGADRFGWRPTEHGALYCRTAPEPRLSCDPLVRDLLVAAEGDDDREVRVRVRADGDLAVDRTLFPAAGATPVRIRTAVPPAGSYVLTASDAAGRQGRETFRCPARGPFVVRVGDGGIAIGSETVGERSDGTATDGAPDGDGRGAGIEGGTPDGTTTSDGTETSGADGREGSDGRGASDGSGTADDAA